MTKPLMDRRAMLAGAGVMAMAAASGARGQEAKTGAAPTAPSAASPGTQPPDLTLYAQSPLIQQIAISPDATQIAFITQKGDQNYLAYFTLADRKLRSSALGSSKIRGLMWASNTAVVVVSSQTDHLPEFAGWTHEFFQAQTIDLVTHKVTSLFYGIDEFYNIIEGEPQRIKIKGEYRVAASSYKMGVSHDLFTYSFLGDSTPHVLFEGSEKTENVILTPEGVPMAYCEFDDDHGTKIWELFLNVSTGGLPEFKKIYTVKGGSEFPGLLGLGRDGKSVVISIITSDQGNYDLHEVSAAGVLSEPLDPKGRDLERSALFHPLTGCLAGFMTRDDWFTYDYFDPLLNKLATAIPQAIGPDYRFLITDFAEDPRKMIVYGESPDDAGSYFFLDFSTGGLVKIASKYPALPQEWITQKQPITYKAADGLEIHAYLTLPPGREAKNLPLIVLPHGGPVARDYVDFDWETQAFASRGYAVLQPNFRGSSGYGQSFIEAGYGEWGRKMQTDLSDGVRDLVKQGVVDAKRVAIYGASYGGYAAQAGATIDHGVYNCAVSVAGLSDPQGFLHFIAQNRENDDSIYVRNERRLMGDPKHYDEISPLKQAANAYCPILLIHGTDDTVVPIDQSQRMERALKEAGKPVEFITYKGQDHWETMTSSRVAMMQSAMDFIGKHNPA